MTTRKISFTCFVVSLLGLAVFCAYLNYTAVPWGESLATSEEVRDARSLSLYLAAVSTLGFVLSIIVYLATIFHAKKMQRSIYDYRVALITASGICLYCLASILYNLSFWMVVTSVI